MRSDLPKVLHLLVGKPLLTRVLDTLDEAGLGMPMVVVGYRGDLIEDSIGARCSYIYQQEQLGTGHATRVAVEALSAQVDRVVVIHGDEPLIGADSLRQMLEVQSQSGAAIVLLTTLVDDTRGFGRLIRDGSQRPVALVQEADLSSDQRAVREVNLGAYVFDAGFLRAGLSALLPHQPKGEYYLTDLVALAVSRGVPVEALIVPGGDSILGINDLVHLEQASRALYQRTAERLMREGVTILDRTTTFIDDDVRIEPTATVHPFSIISGGSMVGEGSIIGPNAHVVSSRIGDRCKVVASTVEDCVLESNVTVGPYAHLRPGAYVSAGCEVGNYAEIKNATLGPRTRMHHFSYVGDAQVGADVNIGAGTITLNYDGVTKHRTVIEDGAFIGSDTLLRAPVQVGKGAATGAGSVITRDVPAGKVAVGMPARVIKTRHTSEGSDSDDLKLEEQKAE